MRIERMLLRGRGRQVSLAVFAPIGVLVALASAAMACVTHTGNAGATHHLVVNADATARQEDGVGSYGNCAGTLCGVGNFGSLRGEHGDQIVSYFERTPYYSASPQNLPENEEVFGPFKVVFGSSCSTSTPVVAQLELVTKSADDGKAYYVAPWTLVDPDPANNATYVTCVIGPVTGTGGAGTTYATVDGTAVAFTSV